MCRLLVRSKSANPIRKYEVKARRNRIDRKCTTAIPVIDSRTRRRFRSFDARRIRRVEVGTSLSRPRLPPGTRTIGEAITRDASTINQTARRAECSRPRLSFPLAAIELSLSSLFTAINPRPFLRRLRALSVLFIPLHTLGIEPRLFRFRLLFSFFYPLPILILTLPRLHPLLT